MHLKKLIPGVLVLGLLLGLLGGCGSEPVSSAEPEETAEVSPAEIPAEETMEVSESPVPTAIETAAEPEAPENTFVYTDGTDLPVSETITAAVTEVDGNTITLSIGSISDMEDTGSDSDMGTNVPEKPENEGQTDPGAGNGTDSSIVPEKPENEGQTDPGAESAMGNDPGTDIPEKPESEGQTDPGAESGTGSDPGAGADVPEKPENEGTTDPGAENGMGNNADNSDVPEKPDSEAGGADAETEVRTAILTIADESVIRVSGADGSETGGSLSDITAGVTLSVEFDADSAVTAITVLPASESENPGSMGDRNGMGGGSPGGMGTGSGVDDYTAVTELSSDTDVEGQTIASTGTDENAILVSGDANVTIRDTTVTRTSGNSTGGDNSSFYGVGAAVLGIGGSTYISDSDISTDAAGGAGVFAYGDAVVYVSDTDITTQKDTSGGIHAAGGGTLYAWQLTVQTAGESAAAIRSDRGGGTMVIDGGTYTTTGEGSPALYCTADITVNDADLTAEGSEAICMEGLNTIHLFDCDVTGAMHDLSQNDTTWNIIVYQSMSGDSEVGTSTMQIVGGSVAAENGGMFYTTNTTCDILISDVDFTYAPDNLFFLQCTGNANQRGWGSTGRNGSQCRFTAVKQDMEGDIIWDSISNLDFYMTGGSTLTGAIRDDETWAGTGGDGACSVWISADSTWTVTGDSTVTSLFNAGKIVDTDGKSVTVRGTDGTVYQQGSGSCTVTVTSYSTSADLSGAAEVSDWSDYSVAKPAQMN